MDILEYDLNIANTIVTTGGNVGIGTTTPISKLDISGSLNVIGDINFTGNLLQNGGSQWTTTSGNVSYTSGSVVVSNLISTGNSNTLGSLFTTGGNIGIGKSNPSVKLDIDGTLVATSATIPQLVVTNASTGIVSITSNLLATGDSNTVGSLFTTSGNVGIGTTSPSARLHVLGSLVAQSATIPQLVLSNASAGTINITSNLLATGNSNTLGSLFTTGGNIGISTTIPAFKLDVNGTFRAYGGRYIIQNAQDGGTGRGIYMWTEADPNWSIYMGQSGAGKSISGGTATTGVYGFNQHAVRFRANNSSANGWIFENNSEAHLMSIRGDTGHVYIAGNLGIGAVSPSYKLHVGGDTRSDGWFRTTGDTGLWSDTYSRGIRPSILGEYGNIETHGVGKNNWEGYSIEGRYVFMSQDNNQCGIFNDVDNNWIMYFDRADTNNRYVQLRHNDNTRLQTTNSGIYINGSIAGNGRITIAGSMEVGTASGDYQHIRIGGGNSSGYIYGAFNKYGDGIHMGYNWYNNNSSNQGWNGSGTSRITCGYGSIGCFTSSGGEPNTGVQLTSNATSWSSVSDIRKKKNIQPLTYGLAEIMSINPIRFDFIADENETSDRLGFSAQEVKDIVKEAVCGTDETGYFLSPTELIPVLVNAIKQLQLQIDEINGKMSE